MPNRWSVLVLTAWLGWGSAVGSDEPAPIVTRESAEQSTSAATPRPGHGEDGEAHGLLARRITKPGPAPQAIAEEPKETTAEPDAQALQAAGWTSLATAGQPAAMPPLPTQEPTQSPLAIGSDWSDCDCCPNPLWCHRSGVFADLLYLRPGNIDSIYAVEQTGTLPTDSPTGPVGRVGFDSALGYRLGANFCLSDCSSIQASYTWFQDGTNSTINATPGTVLIFQPGLPSIPNVGAASIQASARYDIRFQQLDVDYRGLLYGTCNSAVNYFAGLRYANLDQRFGAQEDIGVPVGLTTVRSEINFDGFGIGAGLDGMRRSAYSGLLIYGRASSSFVAGEFKADFRQTSQFGPFAALGNTLVDYRVMTILQSELGAGWQSNSGAIRVTAGYMFAGWFNALTTGSYIPGVQSRQFNNLNETISFDGLVARLLWQF